MDFLNNWYVMGGICVAMVLPMLAVAGIAMFFILRNRKQPRRRRPSRDDD